MKLWQDLLGILQLREVSGNDQSEETKKVANEPSNQAIPSAALTDAILQSRGTLDQFVAAFKERRRAQTDFMVVVLEPNGDCCVPIGILVDDVRDGVFSGRRVANALTAAPGADIARQQSDVIDWRYIDTFEMAGGHVYRELYRRPELDRLIRFTIRDEQPFVIERVGEKEEIDAQTLQVFRDIANGRLDRLQELPASAFAPPGIKTPMPKRPGGAGQRAYIYSVTIQEYAVMYGDRRIIDFLFEQAALVDNPKEGLPPVVAGSSEGNVETTRRLLELRFQIHSALHEAAIYDHPQVVRLLLEHGADCNARDDANETPLMCAQSVEVAKALIEAGADINAIDDKGIDPMSCLDSHFFMGHKGIVRLLVEHGARSAGELPDIVQRDGATVIKEMAESGNPDAVEAEKLLEISNSVDFGCVLPVRSIPKDAVSGILEVK